MSFDTDAGYEFDDDLPVNPIDPGSTVMVAGPALTPAEDLAVSMVTDGAEAGDGMLFVSTNMTHKRLVNACRQFHPSLDRSRLGVIDCSGQHAAHDRDETRVKFVSTQRDLTGIGIKYSALYESLYADADRGRIRTGLISLSSLSMYVDLRQLFQFAQTLSGRIDSADGLGVFTIDPTTHDERTVNTLGQVTDGRIEVRDPDDGTGSELRVRGLAGQPDGWQPFSLR